MESRLDTVHSRLHADERRTIIAVWEDDHQDRVEVTAQALEEEATWLEKQIKRWHVPRLGMMGEEQPEGVFRIMGGQLNSMSTRDARDRKIADLLNIVKTWEVQGGGDVRDWSKLECSSLLGPPSIVVKK